MATDAIQTMGALDFPSGGSKRRDEDSFRSSEDMSASR